MTFDKQQPYNRDFQRALHDRRIHDPDIPEIYNRAYFLDTLSRYSKGRQGVILGIMDVDKFKPINDNWGHLFGDQLMRQIGTEMRTAFRPEDIFARFGGDELAFLILLPEKYNQAQIDQTIETIQKRIDEKITGHNQKKDPTHPNISISTGFSIFSPGDDILTKLDQADQNMYRMKNQHDAQKNPQP